jgi:hypothetical protein
MGDEDQVNNLDGLPLGLHAVNHAHLFLSPRLVTKKYDKNHGEFPNQ